MNLVQTNCPCGSSLLFNDCCDPLIQGKVSAQTAEALMRSRYSGYVTGKTEYILSTWHDSTRPPVLENENIPRWYSL